MDLPAVALIEAAPAKINLALHVTGQRPDAYHLLDSLVVFSTFGDVLSVAKSPVDCFSVDGVFMADVPTGVSNLAVRARDMLRLHVKSEDAARPVSLALVKSLPVASGIGGGSSDAAAVLRSLSKLWGLGLSTQDLMDIGRPLGADVPMCVLQRPLIAKGVGDIVSPLPQFPALDLVLVNPGVALQTPSVFKALASRTNPPLPPLPAGPDFAGLLDWLGASRNDLEAPALAAAPIVADALAALRAGGAAFARMSGSGATCFGLFQSKQAAAKAAAAIRRSRPGWFVVATDTLASSGGQNAGN